MTDPRPAREDSTGSKDSALVDELLSPPDGGQRSLDTVRSLHEADRTSSFKSDPSHRSSNVSGASDYSVNKTAFEKLQALALAKHITVDDAHDGSARCTNAKEQESEDEDDEDDSYEISWDGGPLGLLFKANANGQPVIRRVNKKGAATGLQYARAGDVLLALNGVSVSATPFSEVIEQLKDPEFPVKLDFRPLKLSDLATAASTATSKWGLPRTGSSIHSSESASAFGGSPLSSNATVDLRSHRGGGFGGTPLSMPQVEELGTEHSTDVEYDVEWSEGPLGCELKQRNGLPAVKSVTGTGVTPSVAQIAAGDILVSINGLRVEEIGFKSTVTLMMRATKPVYLRFLRGGARQSISGSSLNDLPLHKGPQNINRRPYHTEGGTGASAALLEAKQYTVLWRDGPLGIQIRTSSKGRVVVARLTGAGAPNVNDAVKAGDIFLRVAGVDVDALGIAGAFEMLKTVQKPVVLVFQRRGRGSTRSHLRDRHFGLPAPAPGPSSSIVPSFRQLREEEAAAAAAAGGSGRSHTEYMQSSDDSRERPISSGFRTLDNYTASDDGTSQASFDYFDSPRSNGSHDPTSNLFNVDVTASENRLPGYLNPPPALSRMGSHGVDDDACLEKGTVSAQAGDGSPSLTELPPPPSYMDVFTASGRAKDPETLVPSSARNTHDDDSAGEYFGDTMERPPPFEAHTNTAPLPPPQYSAAPMPPPEYSAAPMPPPEYSAAQMSPPETTPALLGQPSRLQELRRQYIESERQRNLLQSGTSMSVSTYSDIDDSGLVMRHQPHIPNKPFAVQAPPAKLPLPELWVRWTDGPLGITFKRKNGQIVVSRLTGSGYSRGLTQLRSGDWLVSFNNRSTSTLRLGETMELLKRSPKPVDMCFIVQ